MDATDRQNSPKIRIQSIDVMRGFTLFLMLFVNDLFISNAPRWMLHTEAEVDGLGLSDWVFPGFLFMVGISIPYAFAGRIKKGDSRSSILYHIILRSVSLIIIGLLVVNASRVNAELTGLTSLQWRFLLYICVFLVWNAYAGGTNKWIFTLLKCMGIGGIIALAYFFTAGTTASPEWLIKSWWGILGLIGWGYLACALVYFFIGKNWFGLIGIWFVFLFLNCCSSLGVLDFLAPYTSYINILVQGNVPLIVTTGLLVGVLISYYADRPRKLLTYLIYFSLTCLLLGLFLRNWFIFSKILATPSWGLFCNGISIGLFALIYYLIDVRKIPLYTQLFEKAGKNALTTYLAPDFIYFFVWGFGIPIFFHKQMDSMWAVLVGSLLWAYGMLWFSVLLNKLYIRLKL